MKRSTERILTTHTGSLPRPDDLVTLLYARDKGELQDQAAFETRVREATAEVVRKQIECGVDVVNDGEAGKVGYSTYVKDRLTGFEGAAAPVRAADLLEFPAYARRALRANRMQRPACTGPISYKDKEALQRDIENFKTALQGVEPEEAFLSAASPGVISLFLKNDYYPNHEAYLAALAEAMKEEYNAIHQAGFLLQVDCPDLAMGRHIQFADASLEEFRRNAELHVEALNHALADIPPERIRLHLCWGNYEGPHHRDVPLHDIIDIVLKARPVAISFEAANPRHAHEWKVFHEFTLPADKVLIPGVLDSTTNYIEHPELVAERLCRFAEVVGRENVIAGTDCGFSTFAGIADVDPGITWAKFCAMAEGARLASQQLW
ncbi:MAG TPA: cobalamin-independent methionine synthase II family protein [Candidatus Binatia bacterium]|nr:cobalamin-independent methionine synthase II family protein [Candidatus Binatia bacterium]